MQKPSSPAEDFPPYPIPLRKVQKKYQGMQPPTVESTNSSHSDLEELPRNIPLLVETSKNRHSKRYSDQPREFVDAPQIVKPLVYPSVVSSAPPSPEKHHQGVPKKAPVFKPSEEKPGRTPGAAFFF